MVHVSKSHGFSILEVLVAVGIGGIATAGVVSMMELIGTSTAEQKFMYESNNLNEDLRTLLGSTTSCSMTFGSLRPSSVPVGSGSKLAFAGPITDGTQTYAVGSTQGDNAVKIRGMWVNNNSPATNGGAFTLGLDFAATSKVTGANSLARTINISYTTNTSGNITNCVSQAKATDGLWQMVPHTNTDIYYSAGKVGIGIGAPLYPLDVASQTIVALRLNGTQGIASSNNTQLRFAGGASGELWAIGTDVAQNNGSKDFHFYALPTAGNFTALTLQAGTGYVGVGTLNPQTSLHVYSPSEGNIWLGRGYDFQYDGGNDGNFIFVNSGGAVGKTGFFGNGHQFFSLINASGNVGVNTASPSSTLEVAGTITAPVLRSPPNTTLNLQTTTNTMGPGSIYATSPAGPMFEIAPGVNQTNSWIRSGSGGPGILPNLQSVIIPGLGASGAMAINPGGGTVGIGTNAPQSELDVNGDISLNGVNALRRDGTYAYLFPWSTGYNNHAVVVGGGATTNLMVTGGLGVGYVNNAQPAGNLNVSNNITIGSPTNLYGAMLELHELGVGGGQTMVYLAGKGHSVQAGFNIADGSSPATGYGQIGTISNNGFQLYTNNIPRVTIMPNGEMETGNLLVTGTFSHPSDRKLKTNILPIEDALAKLTQINGVTFNWIRPEMGPEGGTDRQIGVIAQDVEKVFPELVHESQLVLGKNPETIKTVSYTGLIGPIIEAIRELLARILGLDERVHKLEERLRQLETHLAEIEAKSAAPNLKK